MFLPVTMLMTTMTFVASTMIQSDTVTNWGDWGPLDQCPPGSFVKAINVKAEPWQGKDDDTAMNAVHLSCVDLDHQVTTASFNVSKVLKSSEGPFGDFKGLEFCYRGVATGFQLRSEVWQRKGDDTATNDMMLICSNSNGKQKTAAKGQKWGVWRQEKRCPPRTAVCGLQTQVEPDAMGVDNTTLNNVNLLCCELPNPAKTCVPTDGWKIILRRDNSQGTNPLKSAIRERVGVKKTLMVTESSSLMDEIAASVGFSVGSNILGILEANFEGKFSTNPKTQHSWSESGTDVFSFEREAITEITIPAKCHTTLYQIVGRCGPYVVNSNVVKRVDKCVDRRRSIHAITSVTFIKL